MDIKAFSNVNLLAMPASRPAQTNQTVSTPQNEENTANKFKEKAFKAAPFVAGAVILAGLGFYAFKGKVKPKDIKNIAEKAEKAAEAVSQEAAKVVETTEKVVEKAAPKAEKAAEAVSQEAAKVVETTEKVVEKAAPKAEKAAEAVSQEAAKVVEATEKVAEKATPKAEKAAEAVSQEAAKVVETTEKVVEKAAPKAEKAAEATTQEAAKVEAKAEQATANTEEVAKTPVKKKSKAQQLRECAQKTIEELNFHDENIIKKIEDVRRDNKDFIKKVVNENFYDERNLKLEGLKQAIKPIVKDKTRGENRYHLAADIIEKALIRAHTHGSKRQRDGFHLYIKGSFQTPLYNIYLKMPFEEAATRLKYLEEHDLATDCTTIGIQLNEWLFESMQILVRRFKKFKPE